MKNHAFSRYHQRLSFSRNHHLRRIKPTLKIANFRRPILSEIEWKYRLDHWTEPLDPWTTELFWTIFFFFLSSFGPFYRLSVRGSRQLVLREGWDAVYRYSGRSGRQTVITQGEVGDYRYAGSVGEVVVLVNTAYWWSFHWIIRLNGFFDWIFSFQNFCGGLLHFFIFCNANAKLAPQHWSIIVSENIANSLFGVTEGLLSRLEPVLNGTQW